MMTEGIRAHEAVERPTKPFPGLRPFEFDENQLFFGRDGQSDQIIRKLSATRFVAVVGTSGSGKSSLVRAGLLPDLFSGFMTGAGTHWRVALMRPGNDPLGSLASALSSTTVFGSDEEENRRIQEAVSEATLRRGSLGLVECVRQNRMPSGENLLVVVDQFEELFRFARLAGSEQYRYEAAAFVKLLLEAAHQREQNIYVVLTMRSDFLGDCSIFWDLPEAINEGQYLVPRMTRDQRAEAITGPAAVCGGRMTQRLVNRLLNDMGDNPDLLPILQHALMRTWENWLGDHAEDEPVDLRHYEAVGTMAEALSRHADEAWSELGGGRSREIAERVFKALTEKGEDNREVRRPTPLSALVALTGAGEAEVRSVLEVFSREGRSFLVVPSTEDPLVDISHESLIRNWERLKGWVDEESQSAQIYTRLAETAVLHEQKRAGLWRDPDLQLALDWRERTKPTPKWAARYHPAFDSAMKFLKASERRRTSEIRRTRLVAIIFFLLFLLSLAALVYANTKKKEAVAALARVESATIDAQSSRVRADVESSVANIERSRAEENARDALRKEEIANKATKDALDKKKEADDAKAAAEQSARDARASAAKAKKAEDVARTEKSNAEMSATRSRQFLYASDMNLAQQAYESSDAERARELLNAHSPSSGDTPGFDWYYLWNLLNAEPETAYALGNPGDLVDRVAVSGDGRTFAVQKDERFELRDVASGKLTRSVKIGEDEEVGTLAVSPDAKLIAYGAFASTVAVLIDTTTSETFTLKGQKRGVETVAFSPDGGMLAVGRARRVVPVADDPNPKLELFDVKTRQPKVAFEHELSVDAVAFSSNGYVAAGNTRGLVRVWDVNTSERHCDLASQSGAAVTSLVFSPDNELLAAGDSGGNIRLIGMSNCVKERYILGEPAAGRVISAAFSRDGGRLAVIYDDGSLRSWDVSSREQVTVYRGDVNFLQLAYLADGRLLTSSLTGEVILWDVEASVRAQWLKKTDMGLKRVAFSPDDRSLAAGGYNRAVLVWDAATHEFKKELYLLDFGKDGGLEFQWGGGLLATLADGERRARLWDARTFAELPQLEDANVKNGKMALSRDGARLVMNGLDNASNKYVLVLWDVGSRKILKKVTLGNDAGVFALAFSPDRGMIATGLSNGKVRVWDGGLSRELMLLNGARSDAGQVFSVAFSPDGRVLVAGLSTGYLDAWDARTGKELAAPYANEGFVNSVAFSPDGRTFATGGGDKTVRLWSPFTFKQLLTLRGHQREVFSVAFSPDGRTLASSDYGGTVRLWNAASGVEVKATSKER